LAQAEEYEEATVANFLLLGCVKFRLYDSFDISNPSIPFAVKFLKKKATCNIARDKSVITARKLSKYAQACLLVFIPAA
jgi:hypothetical protein